MSCRRIGSRDEIVEGHEQILAMLQDLRFELSLSCPALTAAAL